MRIAFLSSNRLAHAFLQEKVKSDCSLASVFSMCELLMLLHSAQKCEAIVIDEESSLYPLDVVAAVLRTSDALACAFVIPKDSEADLASQLIRQGFGGIVTVEQLLDGIDAVDLCSRRGTHNSASSQLNCHIPNFGPEGETGFVHCPRLTKTECMVIKQLTLRRSNKEIASALFVSERTIRFHVSNILRKLGVDNRYSVIEVIAIMKNGTSEMIGVSA